MGEAYRGVGNKEKSLAYFEACKKAVNNPEFSKDIDEYIDKSFK